MALFSKKSNEEELNTRYTKKADNLLYTPKGENPNVSELVDSLKVGELVNKINNAKNVPEDIKDFLRKAATRFYSFNYSKIAEFYCHQTKEVQELMEDSALVIIDINDAIKNGFCEFNKNIDKLIKESKNIKEQQQQKETPEEEE